MRRQYISPFITSTSISPLPILSTSLLYDNIVNMEDDEEDTPNILDFGHKGNADYARSKSNSQVWD